MTPARELALQLASSQALATQGEPHQTTVDRAEAFLQFLTADKK